VADDIVTRLRCAYSTDGCAEDVWPCEQCTFCAARAEIERLRAEVDLKGYRLDDALDEIERLRTAVAIAAGMLSGCEGFTDKHPEDIMHDIIEEAFRDRD
jgi:hypothetical protein